MKDLLAQLIVCHLIGDFLLQNNWMQAKSRSTFVCTVHVLVYSLPFWAAALYLKMAVLPWMLWAIFAQHWIQDRFQLHMHWMWLYQQTPQDKWPVGPLCVDQAMHIAFIGLVCFLA